MEKKPFVCRNCGATCPIVVTLDGQRVLKVEGDFDAPVYRGYTCPKGRAIPQEHHRPDRLLHSLKRLPDGRRYGVVAGTGRFLETLADLVFDDFDPVVIVARNFLGRKNVGADVEILDFRVVFRQQLELHAPRAQMTAEALATWDRAVEDLRAAGAVVEPGTDFEGGADGVGLVGPRAAAERVYDQGITDATGPKISSRLIVMEDWVSTKSAGSR